MKKLIYYFGFSYLKPKQYWPLRILLLLYFLIIYTGLIYDLTTEKMLYYSSPSEYLNILLQDSNFYYIYITPVIIIFIGSYLWEFFLTVDQKPKQKK
jgi:ABC-type transport system involved in multi-copper enzyme maturation permease subunit